MWLIKCTPPSSGGMQLPTRVQQKEAWIIINKKIRGGSSDAAADNARKQPLGRSMEAISHKHIFTEKSKLLTSKPYLCLHLFKNSKTPQTTCRQLRGSGSGGRSKRYTYVITDLDIINFGKKYTLINDLDK